MRDVLKNAGIDLARRTLLGTSWLNLPQGNMWRPSRVTDGADGVHFSGDRRGLSLRHARLLAPDTRLGDRVVFPVLEGLLPGVCELLPRASAVPYEFEADAFDDLKPIAAPVLTPPALEPFGLGALRRMYPEGHDVLFAEVDGADAEALWKRLDGAAKATGFRPVLLAGPSRNWKWGWCHHLAWRQERTIPGEVTYGLQKDAHPLDDPFTVLAAADAVDTEALLRPGGNPSYPNARPEPGAWPEGEPTPTALHGLVDAETDEPCDEVLMALVPTDSAWKALAFLPQMTLSGSGTPSLAQAVAVSRSWEGRFGARVAVLGSATLNWVVARPPTERAAALSLADAHSAFTPEGGSKVRVERAAELMAIRWRAYWD